MNSLTPDEIDKHVEETHQRFISSKSAAITVDSTKALNEKKIMIADKVASNLVKKIMTSTEIKTVSRNTEGNPAPPKNTPGKPKEGDQPFTL